MTDAEAARLQNDVLRGQRLASLLEDEVIQSVFESLQQDYITAMRAGATREARDEAWAKDRALDDVKARFRAVIDAGTKAAADLERHAKRQEAGISTGRAAVRR